MKTNLVASSLTNHERAVDRSARLDLAIGYPELTEPAWLQELLIRPTEESLQFAYGARSKYPAVQTELLHKELISEVALCLGVEPSHSDEAQIIHTGSYALERVLLSVVLENESILVANPSIDIVTGMLLEQKGVTIQRFNCDSELAPDIDALIASITDDTKAIVIASPENPTGAVLDDRQMRKLVTVALERDIALVFDQCFVKINPYKIHIPVITDYAQPDLKWILTWDTGKTFGFKGDKLAFILSSKHFREAIRIRCNVIRFDVSRRLEILFRSVLRGARVNNYYSWVSEVVRANIEAIETFIASHNLPIKVLRPQAGGLLLLDISHVTPPMSDHDFVSQLLQLTGAGLVHGRDFFYPDDCGNRPPKHTHYVRVAVARDKEVILALMHCLKTMLTH